jgi:hypothetical protein
MIIKYACLTEKKIQTNSLPGLCSSICRIEDEDNEQFTITTFQANMP